MLILVTVPYELLCYSPLLDIVNINKSVLNDHTTLFFFSSYSSDKVGYAIYMSC